MNGQIVFETGRTLNRKNTRTRTVNSGAFVDYARILKTLIGKCRFAFRGKLRFVSGSSSRPEVPVGVLSSSDPMLGSLTTSFLPRRGLLAGVGFVKKGGRVGGWSPPLPLPPPTGIYS